MLRAALLRWLLALAAGLLLSTPARADEITDQIDQASARGQRALHRRPMGWTRLRLARTADRVVEGCRVRAPMRAEACR